MLVQREVRVLEVRHLVGAEGVFENLGIKLGHIRARKNDDVVSVDVKTVGGKIRRTGQHFQRRVGRLFFLNEDFGMGEALKPSAEESAGRVRLLSEQRLELIFEGSIA